MANNVLKGAALAGTALAVGLLSTAPAHALTLSYGPGGNNTATIDSALDAGKSFTIHFDGRVGGGNNIIPGLTSDALFTFLGFNTLGSGANTKTEAKFQIDISNTSSSQITSSRVSAIGFNVDRALKGVGSTNGSGNTRVDTAPASFTNVFTNDRSGAFPNQFGAINVCFTNGNTCQGGGGGGVTLGNVGTFFPILSFNGNFTSFTLSNFGVRYQDIGGTTYGNSGTGVGRVPTPALLPGLLALGAGVLRKRKQLQPTEADAEV